MQRNTIKNEKSFTKETKALIENKYKFNSENVSYFRNSEDLFLKKIICRR